MKRAFFHPTSPFIFVVSDLNILWLDDPLSSLLSPPPPSVLKPHDDSDLPPFSLSVVALLTASPPDRLEVTELTSIYLLSLCPTLRQASPSRRTHRYASGRTSVSAARFQRVARGAAAAAASNTAHHPPPSLLSLSHLTWQTPALPRPLGRRCAPPTRLSPCPSPSWGREAGYGRKGKSSRCLEICPARCQPNAPAPTQRKYD